LRAAAKEGIEPTAVELIRLAEAGQKRSEAGPLAELREALRSLARHGKTFACILVAPRDEACSSRQLRDLASLPVASIAAPKAHLHLWIVPEALEDGLRLLDCWGFRFASSLACAAAPAERGDYWRRAHRNLLLGVRGKLAFRDNRIQSTVASRAIDPDRLRKMVERVSPGPRLDVFGTKAAAGWTAAARQRSKLAMPR
jgi:N6-adenosine-specific RNA methylase IME4